MSGQLNLLQKRQDLTMKYLYLLLSVLSFSSSSSMGSWIFNVGGILGFLNFVNFLKLIFFCLLKNFIKRRRKKLHYLFFNEYLVNSFSRNLCIFLISETYKIDIINFFLFSKVIVILT